MKYGLLVDCYGMFCLIRPKGVVTLPDELNIYFARHSLSRLLGYGPLVQPCLFCGFIAAVSKTLTKRCDKK